MELKMQPFQRPEVPQFNYEQLKAALQEKMVRYESAVYTDGDIQTAKTDRAALNKLRKALNDERIRQEREYMQPFSDFKAKINELISIIDTPIRMIDEQVRDFDTRQKAEKYQKIEAYWHGVLAAGKIPAGICFKHIFSEKWLNASVSLKSVYDAIDAKVEQIDKDLAVIDSLPAYAYEAKEAYLSSLDLAKAVSEAHRLEESAKRKAAYEAEMSKRKAEQEAMRQAATTQENRVVEPEPVATQPTEPMREWLGFKAYLSIDEAAELGAFFKSRGIQYKSI